MLNFVVLFLLVSGLMYLGTMNNNNQEKDVINFHSKYIEVLTQIIENKEILLKVIEAHSLNSSKIIKKLVEKTLLFLCDDLND